MTAGWCGLRAGEIGVAGSPSIPDALETGCVCTRARCQPRGRPEAGDVQLILTCVNPSGSFLDPAIVPTLRCSGAFRKDSRDLGNRSLSEREKTVLELVAEGRRNKEIARRLNISERTVKFHISGRLSKLNAGNRTQAVSIASQHGLLRFCSPHSVAHRPHLQ
ncbi:MAG: response regulator transcription factor [Gammaproteobacteria bacterium]